MTHLLYPDCLKRRLQSIDIRTASINAPAPQYIRITNMAIRIWSSGSLTKVKRVLHAITTTNHGPRPITCRVKGRVEVTTRHFPRSFYMITSHNLWQPHHLPRFLTAARRVVMTLLPSKYHHDNIKYLPTINERNSTPGTIYKPSHEEEGNLLIPSKRSTDLYLPL